MDNSNDNSIVMTLDAGGTNFVFSAIQANREMIESITCPSNAHNLDLCLKTILKLTFAAEALFQSEIDLLA